MGRLIPSVVLAVAVPAVAFAQSIVGSKHDLSDPAGTTEACVFCHTPHQASAAINAPLWNRQLGPVTFTPYSSSTLDSSCPATPSSYSQACLACHDGVNAGNDKHDLVVGPGGSMPDMTSWPNCARCHPQMYGGAPVKWLGTDLRNSHPISMAYPTPAHDPEFNTPPDLQRGWGIGPSELRLYDGKVECPSCHNVHNPSIRPFLRKSNAGSALCLTCHVK